MKNPRDEMTPENRAAWNALTDEERAAWERIAEPIHPGEVLREDYMKPLGLSATALAIALGVTPARINEIVNGKRGITAETALRLGRYFNVSAELWMALQASYDLEVSQAKFADAIAHIRPRPLAPA